MDIEFELLTLRVSLIILYIVVGLLMYVLWRNSKKIQKIVETFKRGKT